MNRLILVLAFLVVVAPVCSAQPPCRQHPEGCQHFCSMGSCNGCVNENFCRMAATNDAQSWIRRGVAAIHNEGTDKAERCFKMAITYDVNNADALYDLGVINEYKGDYAAAYQWYQKAHAADPKDGEINAALQYVGAHLSDVRSANPRICVIPHNVPRTNTTTNIARPLHGVHLGCPVCGALNQTPLRAVTPFLPIHQLLDGF